MNTIEIALICELRNDILQRYTSSSKLLQSNTIELTPAVGLLKKSWKNAEGSLTIMSSRQAIAVAAVHTNLKVSEYPNVRGISVMEMPEMLWKGCRASKRLKSPPFMSQLIN